MWQSTQMLVVTQQILISVSSERCSVLKRKRWIFHGYGQNNDSWTRRQLDLPPPPSPPPARAHTPHGPPFEKIDQALGASVGGLQRPGRIREPE